MRPRTKIGLAAGAGATAAAALLVVALAALVPLPEGFFLPGSTVVELADGGFGHVFLSPDEKWRIEVGLSEVDPAYVEALIRLEDRRFWYHPGVDPIAILRAAASNLLAGHVVSGGSTLTMQLVRVREPRPRNLGSKLIEAFRALQLEVRLSKSEILEAYLQYVPYGRNIEGVEAASLSYFGHRATALSPAEIATLLAVPQLPSRRFPSPRNRAALTAARDELAHRLLREEALPLGRGGRAATPEEVLAEVRAAPVPVVLGPFPRLAPHAAGWIRAQRPGSTRLRTTLDRGAQLLAERVLAGAADENERLGIHNGAVVIVEHATSEVRGLAGSFDFFDDRHGGQIVGFDTPRSPGSALKPLLYAMGIDRGLLLPDFLVLDTPRTYGTYSPKNYDGEFSGLVRFEDALSRSLNVPFVALSRRLGVDRLIGTLGTMGVESLDDRPGHYGLSAAIGGLELTPLELAGIYATFAEAGRYRPLRWLDEERTEAASAGEGVAIFSPGAAWLTRRALMIRDRPDFPERRRMTGAPPSIFWKTGTSYGHRDAWAAGAGPRYTAVVWLGNLDNTPSRSLVGAEVAAPLLFDLLEGLGTEGPAPPEGSAPRDLTSIEVCAYSGRLAGPACPHHRRVLALARSVPTERCPYHVQLDVDVETGLALAPACRGDRRFETRSFVVWPSSLRRFLDDQHRTLPEPPSFAPGCVVGLSRSGPAILSPPANHVALLVPGLAATEQEIPLAAESAGGVSQLSWFVDGEFLGTVRGSERLWWTPSPGRHELVVTDEAGRSARRRLEVKTRM